MNKTLYFVLGMHRSGTSLITRALQELGLELGDNLLPAGPDNPTGFWEDMDVFHCNEQLLASLGLDWDTLTIEPLRGLNGESISELSDKAEYILKKKLDGVSYLAIKDPRLCLLLPVWRIAALKLNIDIRYIVVLRNPLDVAESLSARNHFDQRKGLVLWRNHYCLILKLLSNYAEPRIVVDYRSFMKSPESEMYRMSKFVDIDGLDDFIGDRIAHFSNEFVRPELCHAISSLDVLQQMNESIPGVKGLFILFTQFCEFGWNMELTTKKLTEIDLSEIEIENYSMQRAYVKNTRHEMHNELTRELTRKDEIYQKQLKTTEEEYVKKLNDLSAASAHELQKLKLEQDEERKHFLQAMQQMQEGRNSKLEQRIHELDQWNLELSKERGDIIAALEKKDHEVCLLKHSLSWRLTSPLRLLLSLPRIFSNLLHGDRLEDRISPLMGVEALPAGGWRSVSDDPAFLVPLRSAGLTPGFYKVELSGDGISSPELFLDMGDDFSADHCYPLENQDGMFCLNVRLRGAVRRLRLDPRRSPGDFSIKHLRIWRRSRLAVVNQVAWSIYQRERKVGNGIGKILADKLSIVRRIGFMETLRNIESYTMESGITSASEKAIDYPRWITSVEAEYFSKLQRDITPNLTHLYCVIYNGSDATSLLEQSLESAFRQLGNTADVMILVQSEKVSAFINFWPKVKVVAFDVGVMRELVHNYRRLTFVTCGWQLSPYYNMAVSQWLAQYPATKYLLYTDHDDINEKGLRQTPHFKPDWSPDYLLEYDYVGGVVTLSSNVLADFTKKTDYPDKVYCVPWWIAARIALVDDSPEVLHIPFMLSHRMPNTSRFDSNERTVLLRSFLGKRAKVVPGVNSDVLRVIYQIEDPAPLVTIVIPTRDRLDLLRCCIETLRTKTDYPAYRLLVLDNGSVELDCKAYLEKIAEEDGVDVLSYDHPFNFSSINNYGVAKSSSDSELICFLNNDVEIIDTNWLTELVGQLNRDGVGCVGAKLLYPNGKIQHGGVVVGHGGIAGHAFVGEDGGDLGYEYRLSTTQNCSAMTAACMLTRRDLFVELGGFNERYLAVAFNDIDYCLRVKENGLRLIWTPHTQLIHHESASRVPETERIAEFTNEIRYMQVRWGNFIKNDPAYNPHLSLDQNTFTISDRWLKKVEEPATGVTEACVERQIYDYDGNIERVREVVKGRRVLSNSGPFERGLSIAILNLDKPDLINPLIDALVKAKRELCLNSSITLQIIVGDTGSTDESVLQGYAKHAQEVEIMRDMQYHFSRCNNDLFENHVRYQWVLFLNNDVVFSDPCSQLKKMLEIMEERPEIGVLGTRLMYPDGRLQHGGVDIFREGDLKGLCYHPGHAQHIDIKGVKFGELKSFPAVTGACLMISSELFLRCGGFDEAYEAEAQDVDLCLKAGRLGKKSYVLELGKVVHIENATRTKGEASNCDRSRFVRKWNRFVEVLY